jgi:catechol 2,3-dioxygenase-like lactoylglutathione lyase family enzyme
MRVNGLLHCGLQVPSLEAGLKFYSDFGLDVTERGNTLVVRCAGRDQDQIVLTEGPRKRLHHVAFAVDPGSLPAWQRHLEELGADLADAPAGVAAGGLWFRDMAESVVLRTRQQVAALFGDLESIEPGIVQLPRWHPAPDAPAPGPLPMWCGVAQ